MPVYSIDVTAQPPCAREAAAVPIVLTTSATRLERIPEPVIEAGHQIWLGAPPAFVPPPGAAGWVVWHEGDEWRQGSVTRLRAALRVPQRRYFLPVHYPYWSASGLDLDLIGLEPKLFSPAAAGQPREDSVEPRIRIRRAPGTVAAPPVDEPWSELTAAVESEAAQPGSGLAGLAQLAQNAGWHPLLRGLCLRNLVLALARRDGWAAAGILIAQARNLLPAYRELNLLAALAALEQAQPGEAIAALRRAAADSSALMIGSGGESGYRAHYLLARVAEQTGSQAVAHHHFMTGVRQTPVFAPSLAGLLRQRLPPELLEACQADLNRVARRQPQHQPVIFEYLLLHQAWELAERSLRTWPLAADMEAALTARWRATVALRQPMPRRESEPFGVVLAGPLQNYSSVAGINRQLATALASDPKFEMALAPTLAAEQPPTRLSGHEAWAAALHRLPRRLDVTLRHGWPPDFSRPPAGQLALILPWEFGAIPRLWQRGLGSVDRVIVPSAFVREVLLRAGVDSGRISVIPNGVDLRHYRPEGDREAIAGARGVTFLFVGGAIERKGMDLLLRAWRAAFTASDDVSLVIKDLGARSFYRHLTLRDAITELAREASAAPIIYLDDDWPEERMPGLYRAADVLVLPYRGEGFGLPLAEALACGKPVITTGAGPAPEFCDGAWFIPASEVEVPAALRPSGAMSGPVTWFEPDFEALVDALRAAAASPAERAERGRRGAARIHRDYGWDAVTAQYRAEFARLMGDLPV